MNRCCSFCKASIEFAWECVSCADCSACADCVLTIQQQHIFVLAFINIPKQAQSISYIVERHESKRCGVCACNLGSLWQCTQCAELYLCQNCLNSHSTEHCLARVAGTVTKASEVRIQTEPVFVCDICQVNPIVGPRWHCMVCKDFDLCFLCAMSPKCEQSHKGHKFVLHNYFFCTGLLQKVPEFNVGNAPKLKLNESPELLSRLTANEYLREKAFLISFKQAIPKTLRELSPLVDIDRIKLLRFLEKTLDLEIQIPENAKSAHDWFLQVLFDAHFSMSMFYPRLAVSIGLAEELMRLFHQPRAMDDVDVDREQLIRAEEQIYWRLFQEAQMPEWTFNPSSIRNGLDIGSVKAVMWCLLKEKNMCNEPVSSTISHPSTDQVNSVNVVQTSICDCLVTLVPLLQVFKIAYNKQPAPMFQDCQVVDASPLHPDSVIVFVSHRWETVKHPDPLGQDWDLLAKISIDLIESCVLALEIIITVLPSLPLEQMLAATQENEQRLVYVDLNHLNSESDDENPMFPTISGDLLAAVFRLILRLWAQHQSRSVLIDQVQRNFFIWYDYTCLPQRQKHRSDDQLVTLRQTLRNLGNIQNKMNTVVLNTSRDFLKRAWCIGEWLNASYCSLAANTEDENPTTQSLFSNLIRLDLRTKVTHTMLSLATTTPKAALQQLQLLVTNTKDDSESVCRILWHCAQKESTFIELYPLEETAPLFFPVGYSLAQKQLIIAMGTDTSQIFSCLDFVHNFKENSFDQWLCLRQNLGHLNSMKEVDRSQAWTLYFFQESMPGTLDRLRDLRRDLNSIRNIIFAAFNPFPSHVKVLTICLIDDINAFQFDATTFVAGYAGSRSAKLHSCASFLVPGQVVSERKDPFGFMRRKLQNDFMTSLLESN